MEKITLSFTNQEIEIVYKALLEMPARLAIPIMKMIEEEVKNIKKYFFCAVEFKKFLIINF